MNKKQFIEQHIYSTSFIKMWLEFHNNEENTSLQGKYESIENRSIISTSQLYMYSIVNI